IFFSCATAGEEQKRKATAILKPARVITRNFRISTPSLVSDVATYRMSKARYSYFSPKSVNFGPKLDPTCAPLYNNKFTVIHIFDLLNRICGPAATCRAALFL